ncbi:MAG: MFS transporter, partial [Gammaproteobacteria bacterium]|nr:MFS transporter [Gammaproteobacteria bacterium]
AIFLARHSRPERLAKIAVWACVVNALLLLILGYTRDLHLAVAIVGLAGAAATLCGIAVQTLLQLTVDDDKRGRVMGLWGVFAMGGSALGGLVLGAFADAVALSTTIRWDAGLCLVLTLLAGRRLALKSGAGRRMSHAISRNRTVVTESR